MGDIVKKNLLLIIILFLLCGCSVEYEIELNDVLKLNENIKIIPSTVEEENSLSDYNTYLPVDFNIDERGAFENKYDDLEYYNYKLNSNNAMNIKYSHNFPPRFDNNIIHLLKIQYKIFIIS